MAVALMRALKFLPILLVAFCYCDREERVTYAHTERPRVIYFNTKYFNYLNLSAHRHGRANKIYYVDLLAETKVVFGNNVSVDFYFYEWLTNKYVRSFVEMHFGLCDLIHKDNFFGAAMKQGKLDAPCPYPPGKYHMYNMTVLPDVIPIAFPFRKGRLEANITNKKEFMGHGYIDFEIRDLKMKKRTKNTKL